MKQGDSNSTETFPIELLLDMGVLVEADRQGVLRWLVRNTGDQDISLLILNGTSRQAEHCRLGKTGLRRGVVLKPGEAWALTQSIDATDSGIYGVRFDLHGHFSSGRRFAFTSEDLLFQFHRPGEGPTITINGGTGIYLPNGLSGSNIDLKSEKGIVNAQGPMHASGNINIDAPNAGVIATEILAGQRNLRSFDIKSAKAVRLHPLRLDGIDELDFGRIAADWRGAPQNEVSLRLVDANDNVLDKAYCKGPFQQHGTPLRFRIRSNRPGQLSLFYRGVEDEIYQLWPLSEVQERPMLQAGDVKYYPDDFVKIDTLGLTETNPDTGKVAPVDHIRFTEPGTEQLLAVITARPDESAEPVPFLKGPSPNRLRELLEFWNLHGAAIACLNVEVCK